MKIATGDTMNLVKYETAKQALAEYKTVDEVKDFRDKTVAIQAYAKQANDYDLERDASIARVRSERRCGELLKETVKLGRPEKGSDETTIKSLAEMGVTKDQSSNWQKLADVSEKQFEEIINNKGMPVSGGQVLSTVSPIKPTEKTDTSVLWLWGRLRDMEKDNIFARPLSEYINSMTNGMKPDALRIVPKLTKWLNEYE